MSKEQGQILADELGIPFMEVSAKANINVDKAFYSLATDIKKRIIDTQAISPSAQSSIPLDNVTGGSGNTWKNCC